MAKDKTPDCNRGCGQKVWFNWNAKAGEPGRSDMGKLRPLQVSEEGLLLDEVHECPNSTYNKQQRGGGNGQATTTTSSAAVMEKLEAINANVMGLALDLGRTNEKIDSLTKVLMNMKIGQRNLNGDPNYDDDGDSSREIEEGDYPER